MAFSTTESAKNTKKTKDDPGDLCAFCAEKTGDYRFLDNDIGGEYNAARRTARPAATIPSWEVTCGL
jgi:hypothetical protein